GLPAAREPRLHRARVRAPVAGVRVPVVAGLGSLDEAISTHDRHAHRGFPGALESRIEHARVRAAVAGGHVAVVARLTGLDDTVAAHERGAHGRLSDAREARLDHAYVRAPVAGRHVPVVARLGSLDEPVAAAGDPAGLPRAAGRDDPDKISPCHAVGRYLRREARAEDGGPEAEGVTHGRAGEAPPKRAEAGDIDGEVTRELVSCLPKGDVKGSGECAS